MNGAGRRRTETHPFTKRANICADYARTLDACGVATPYRKEMKIGSDGSRTRACAGHIPQPFPRRLRPTSFRSHATVSTIHREVIGVAYPTRMTLPTHLRSVDSSARSFASFRSARRHPWPLDSRSPEDWVMRGAW